MTVNLLEVDEALYWFMLAYRKPASKVKCRVNKAALAAPGRGAGLVLKLLRALQKGVKKLS